MQIEVKKFEKEHIETRVEWINDKRINATMFFNLPATVEKTTNWFENNKGSQERVDFTFLQKNKILAMTGITSISSLAKHAEFYVMVNPEMQGRGIGKEVSQWTCNYAFNVKGLNKLYLYTNNDNKAAYMLYEKLGFRLEGILRQHKYKNGTLLDRRFYGLLREEWENEYWKSETVIEI